MSKTSIILRIGICPSYLTLKAKTTLKHNHEMREKYEKLRKREKNPLKAVQALIAIGLKMIRIVFKLAKSKIKYEPEKVYV
ncbi:hypothetical protein [Thermosipho africanus]|uniref:hypothetical protein n=1 Tax=Thermosipho africanus TaxID=2421 RepID=UPI00268FBE1E